MKTLLILTLFLSLVLASSCDRPDCVNDNPVFDSNEPNSQIYKAALKKALAEVDSHDLRYWLQKYEKSGNKDYLYFYVQGDGLCAKIMITANDWGKLSDVVEAEGVSYRNAEFTELKYDILDNSGDIEFVFRDFGNIID